MPAIARTGIPAPFLRNNCQYFVVLSTVGGQEKAENTGHLICSLPDDEWDREVPGGENTGKHYYRPVWVPSNAGRSDLNSFISLGSFALDYASKKGSIAEIHIQSYFCA